ncbi:melatonin receptor type 1B-B-like isoform X1 [Harmonia axyridis]|uniref:melatonin receptor type 1B-B-like isoform X1 n=1 Tax=Harmonia axyridis TaxID=115357 RepID=UPI001E2795A4|nr:melatonin receptor type 1B-B-like isoform X1 [Harmonia axyridis]XP_045463320.1 melatonin receptor type 1B-B-like isoform X1 [Harmonia axyridis]XP_045463321.1 melatonin receptor type 1B-B-like isoform X1 [Harmonia axyridis]
MSFAKFNSTDIPDNEFMSPVTLSDDWSRMARLMVLVCLASVGSVGNVFMISAVMIDDYLRKKGNTFVVNIALADFLVSGLVMPASAVVILAGIQDNLDVCRFQWFLAALCFLVSVLSIAAVAGENYLRLCCTAETNAKLTSGKITTLLVVFWSMSSLTSGLQFAPRLSFDYCTRKTPGLIPYQITVAVVFVFLPVFLSLYYFVTTFIKMKGVRIDRPNYKIPVTVKWDHSLMLTNLYSFIFFVVFWLPFGVVLAVGTVNRIPNRIFYNFAWLGISKSCINSIIYCITNRHFRGAYVKLFHYCCCKTTVSFSRRHRPEGIRPSGDVRVHIIPGYNMYCSPQRGREAQLKRSAIRTNGGDIYEL